MEKRAPERVNLPSRKPAVKNGLAWLSGARGARLLCLLRSIAARDTYGTARATEGYQRTQPCREHWTDPSYVAERVDCAERTQGIPVGDDSLGERRADAGKPLHVLSRGAVEIDRLRRVPRLGIALPLPDRFLAYGLLRRRSPGPRSHPRRVHALDLVRQRLRLSLGDRRPSRPPQADGGPGERDDGEEPERFAFISGWHMATNATNSPMRRTNSSQE